MLNHNLVNYKQNVKIGNQFLEKSFYNALTHQSKTVHYDQRIIKNIHISDVDYLGNDKKQYLTPKGYMEYRFEGDKNDSLLKIEVKHRWNNNLSSEQIGNWNFQNKNELNEAVVNAANDFENCFENIRNMKNTQTVNIDLCRSYYDSLYHLMNLNKDVIFHTLQSTLAEHHELISDLSIIFKIT